VLVNNAGIGGPDDRGVHTAGGSGSKTGSGSVADVQAVLLRGWDGWADTFAINASAVMLVAACFLPLLEAANVRRGWEAGRVAREEGAARKRSVVEAVDADDSRLAQIITVASIAAFSRHVTASFAYSASKAAAVHLGKSLAYTLAPWGIRSNIICPGRKCFELIDDLQLWLMLLVFHSPMTEGLKDVHSYDQIPLHRPGNFNEVAATILSIVGKGGAYLNGHVQIVDGGRLSMMPATY
jgi:NAD(P)-dependent dehydrogenase (short-subunit alcohol dehydrogenase family)